MSSFIYRFGGPEFMKVPIGKCIFNQKYSEPKFHIILPYLQFLKI